MDKYSCGVHEFSKNTLQKLSAKISSLVQFLQISLVPGDTKTESKIRPQLKEKGIKGERVKRTESNRRFKLKRDVKIQKRKLQNPIYFFEHALL